MTLQAGPKLPGEERAFAALYHRDFRFFFIGTMLAMMGDNIELFGPAVGAALMLLLGPPLALVANVLIYFPLTLWLLYVPYNGHLQKEAPPKRAMGWNDAVNVFREAARNRAIMTMVLLGGSASFFVGNAVQTQMPAFAYDLGAGTAIFLIAPCSWPQRQDPCLEASCSKERAGFERAPGALSSAPLFGA